MSNKPAYQRWNNFRQWVLDPAIAQINDFGTVTIRMTPEKVGRAISAVRFDWQWKTIDEARETEEENERHDIARRKPADEPRTAPPLMAPVQEVRQRPSEQERAQVAAMMAELTNKLKVTDAPS